MRINEIAKDRSCTAIEKDPLHLLLEIERRFRAEERKNLRSERGRSHQNLLRIIKEQSGVEIIPQRSAWAFTYAFA